MPHSSGERCAVSVRSADYSIGDRVIFAGADFHAGHRESVAVMGPSGSGKTTLLMAIAGLLDLDTGSVQVEGTDISSLSSARRARFRLENVGFVFQFAELLPDLSAWENVALPAMLKGASRSEARAAALQCLTATGVGSLAERNSVGLSGGERQRVAIARALVTRPSVLLADEPTGALDEESSEAVANLLFALPRERECCLVVVTHNEAVAALADRRVVLSHGTFEALA